MTTRPASPRAVSAQIHRPDAVCFEEKRATSLIRALDVGVHFTSGPRRDGMDARLFGLLQKRVNRQRRWVLEHITVEGQAGEIIGVIGKNGAGKTTLCRVISGILKPDAGAIDVFADVSTLLSLGTGFNPQLSGRENVFLNGMMLGMPRTTLVDRVDAIRDFSGLGDFIEAPLKVYSSGMRSRLAFSVAAMVAPQILILDEALSVGDIVFARKAAEQMRRLVDQAKMVLLVTHHLDFVKEHCTRALWIDAGQIAADGDPVDVIDAYRRSIKRQPAKPNRITFAPTAPKATGRLIVDAHQIGIGFSLNGRGVRKKDGSPPTSAPAAGEKIFWPLKQVSFQVREGEIVGIIGLNGAGKTTICKILAGILKPDRGRVRIDGRVTALLAIGIGFNTQLTGRDNVFLNGMLMGFSKRRLQACFDDIVDFAEIGSHIDMPVKHYSTGMRARLGFSIAAAIDPDVLIVDEVLSVGDAAFQVKAAEKMQMLMQRTKAVIVVTHNMALLKQVCTRAMWLADGEIRYDGSPTDAVALYQKENCQTIV